MTMTHLEEFRRLFLDVVGEVVAECRFEYLDGYSRPRGVVLEYAHDTGKARLFAACEGDVVVFDFIRRDDANHYWRVSLNQALWFAGIRAISRKAPLKEQLGLFESEMPRYCNALLARDSSLLDPRYCYPMSADEVEDYMAAQRGIDRCHKGAK